MKLSKVVGVCVAVTGICAVAGCLIYFVILSPKSQDVQTKSNSTAGAELHQFVQKGEQDSIKHLILTNGADVNFKDSSGNTALHIAVANRNYRLDFPKIITFLLENGADPNIQNNQNKTPLFIAAERGNNDAKILLKFGVDVNKTFQFGSTNSTALITAAEYGSTEVAKTLLQHGSALNARNQDGRTALHEAAYYGHAKTIDILIEFGATVDALDNNGWTPLLCGAYMGHQDVVQRLIIKGVDVNKNGFHWSQKRC